MVAHLYRPRIDPLVRPVRWQLASVGRAFARHFDSAQTIDFNDSRFPDYAQRLQRINAPKAIRPGEKSRILLGSGIALCTVELELKLSATPLPTAVHGVRAEEHSKTF